MVLFNNRYISSYKIIFLLIDTALLVGAVAMGYYIRFLAGGYPISLELFSVHALFFAFVFQISLHYFELYDLKIIRDGSKFGFRFIQSLAVTVILLMITYYLFPYLTLRMCKYSIYQNIEIMKKPVMHESIFCLPLMPPLSLLRTELDAHVLSGLYLQSFLRTPLL